MVAMVVGPLLAVVAPYTDRRDLWVVDGDAARWISVDLMVIGTVLRLWPMFVLGRRFSAFIAMQERNPPSTARNDKVDKFQGQEKAPPPATCPTVPGGSPSGAFLSAE